MSAKNRSKTGLIGRDFMKLGYQVLVPLGRQKNLQPRIGIYFVERGILTSKKLDAMMLALKEHNRKHWFKK